MDEPDIILILFRHEMRFVDLDLIHINIFTIPIVLKQINYKNK